MAIDSKEHPEVPEGAELLKLSRATNVTLYKQADQFVVTAGGDVITRTRVRGLADAEYDAAVEDRAAPLRARLATERAAGAYASMASENGAARTSKAQRGGKGGRGGV